MIRIVTTCALTSNERQYCKFDNKMRSWLVTWTGSRLHLGLDCRSVQGEGGPRGWGRRRAWRGSWRCWRRRCAKVAVLTAACIQTVQLDPQVRSPARPLTAGAAAARPLSSVLVHVPRSMPGRGCHAERLLLGLFMTCQDSA